MDVWLTMCRFVVDHTEAFGLAFCAAAFLMVPLTPMVSTTAAAHARAIPAFQIWPWQHWRLLGFAFSRAAWAEASASERRAVLLYRIAVLLGYATGLGLLVSSVAVG